MPLTQESLSVTGQLAGVPFRHFGGGTAREVLNAGRARNERTFCHTPLRLGWLLCRFRNLCFHSPMDVPVYPIFAETVK